MIKTTVIDIPTLVEDSIICNKCKKEYSFNLPENFIECDEFVRFRGCGGYGSIVGDCVEYSFDLCQHCALEILGQYYNFSE